MSDSLPTKKGVRLILKAPHSEECFGMKAVRNRLWNTPWYFPGESMRLRRNGTGGRGANYVWVVVRCNSSNCKAWGLVSQEDLLETIRHE